MVGFSDVVEVGGEGGVGSEVKEGRVVERDNWLLPFHFDRVLFIGWEIEIYKFSHLTKIFELWPIRIL